MAEGVTGGVSEATEYETETREGETLAGNERGWRRVELDEKKAASEKNEWNSANSTQRWNTGMEKVRQEKKCTKKMKGKERNGLIC